MFRKDTTATSSTKISDFRSSDETTSSAMNRPKLIRNIGLKGLRTQKLPFSIASPS